VGRRGRFRVRLHPPCSATRAQLRRSFRPGVTAVAPPHSVLRHVSPIWPPPSLLTHLGRWHGQRRRRSRLGIGVPGLGHAGVQRWRDQSSSARAGARASSEPWTTLPRGIGQPAPRSGPSLCHPGTSRMRLYGSSRLRHGRLSRTLLEVVLGARQPIIILHAHAQPAQREANRPE
jgi:hypothetical protein